MTLPSLPELKRLQAEATPGPWVAKWCYHVGHARPDNSATIHAGREYLGISYGANAELKALAPALLADNIRMREALTGYIDVLHELKDGTLAAVAKDLTRILGDTE